MTGDGSNIWCCKEQYCIGTWNVRSTNQGKLEGVKQEMARVNKDILGISELNWTGMDKFNSDDCYIYYCGWEYHRRNGVALIVNKSLKCSTRMQPQKRQNDLTFFPRQTIEHHGVQSLCAKHWCGRNWSWLSLWRPTRLSRTKQKKISFIITEDWNTKVGSQEIPGITGKLGLGVQNEAGQRLTVFCQ